MNSFVLPILLALSLPPGLDATDTVALDEGVMFAGAECQREAAIGGPFALEVYFHAPEPLARPLSALPSLDSAESVSRLVHASTNDGGEQHQAEEDAATASLPRTRCGAPTG